jgi:TonB family protein
MRRFLIMVMIVMALPQFASAGQMVSYIAMPTGIGHATDAKGVRYPNAICMKDVLYADQPQYPYDANLGAAEARDIQANGLFRLSIDINTGRVMRVQIIKSMGDRSLDNASINAFKRWVFRPGKWQEIIVPTTVRKKWVAVRWEATG